MLTIRQDPKSKSSRKVAFASFIGTAVEWYDFYLFGTASALIFNQLFFPTFSPIVGVMSSFATLAVGFFARPFGGIVFGHFGDRISRKNMLIITLAIMGISTFLIGLLPTYDKIGIFAPILLVILRILQGIGVGGEWGGAVVMTAEKSREKERGFYASWPNAGAPIGLIGAIVAFMWVSSLPSHQFMTWGWRLPFLFGVVLLVIGIFIRFNILESGIFLKKKRKIKYPGLEVIKKSPKNFLLAIGARFAESSSYYIFTVFILSYGTENLKLSKNALLAGVLIASVLQAFSIVSFGRLSDHIGRRPVYIGGAILLALFAFPFFMLVQTKNMFLIYCALVFGLCFCHAMMHGPQAAFYSELFKTRIRYSGIAMAYHISAALSGGLAPLIATGLVYINYGHTWAVSIYLIIMSLITIISVFLAEETARDNIEK